jgi:23S rRNA pseudouridine1911/1915/1917 synthase
VNKYVASLTWKVEDDWDNQLLRLFLKEHCHISKRALADIKFNGGLILLNQNEVTVRVVVHTGDEVKICLPLERASTTVHPESILLDIVFEDEHVLVINKQAGMPTIPSREHPTGTLANAVLGYFRKINHNATFHAVNRLDKDTSGLLVIAKHRFAHDRLSKLQQAGKLKRYYTAIVSALFPHNTGTISVPIGRDPNSIIARVVRDDGKHAITHFSVKTRSDRGTVIEINLETGRTHQIRVHFAHLGYPLLGDDLYGGMRNQINRQALHCHRIEFLHPFDNQWITVKKAIPEDMQFALPQTRVDEG